MKILVFVATAAEINKKLLENLSVAHELIVIYTGMGKVRAAVSATEALFGTEKESSPVQLVINLGTAGSHSVPVGTLVECTRFVERDVDLTSAGVPAGYFPGSYQPPNELPKRLLDLPSAICGTGDRIDLRAPDVFCEVYDMEAFSLAYVCQKKNVPFMCLKYITDASNNNVYQDWKSNLVKAQEALLSRLRSFLAESNPLSQITEN